MTHGDHPSHEPATDPAEPARPPDADAGEVVIPVVAEALQVERRRSDGALRVRKVVTTAPAAQDVELHDELVEVERVPIGRVLDGPIAVRHEGDVMIVPVVEERLVVEKRRVLVEEVRIVRRQRTRHESQQATLRRETVLVERRDPETHQWLPAQAPPGATQAAQTGRADGASAAPAPTDAQQAPEAGDCSNETA